MSNANDTDRVRELEKLLAGLLDGIDGYESEAGTLHPYWNAKSVEAARSYLESLPDHGAAAGYWLAETSRPGDV